MLVGKLLRRVQVFGEVQSCNSETGFYCYWCDTGVRGTLVHNVADYTAVQESVQTMCDNIKYCKNDQITPVHLQSYR